MNEELFEDEIGDGTFASITLDVAHALQARYGLGDAALEPVYNLAGDMLTSSFNDFTAVSIPSTPGASEPITLAFLLDKFRSDLTAAADELLVS